MIDHLPDRLDLYAMAEAGRTVQGRVTLASLKRVLPLVMSDAGVLQVALETGRDQDGTHYLSGSISGVLQLQCQRCLETMEFPLDVKFHLGLVQGQEEVKSLPDRYEPLLVSREPAQIAEVISDEVLLALPIVPLHDDMDQCQALAADYKASADEQRENPFAVLAQLKQKQ